MVEDAWRFTPVYELNSCLTSGAESLLGSKSPQPALESTPTLLVSSDNDQNPPGLGNFDKIWRYFNLPLSLPTVQIESPHEVTVTTARTEDLCYKSLTDKGVRRWDGTESADLAVKEEIANSVSGIGLTKASGKKERRRKRSEEAGRGSSPQKVLSEVTERRYNLRQPRPRSATEVVIRQILSDTVTKPETPSKLSRLIGVPPTARDHINGVETSLHSLKKSLAGFKLIDQTDLNTAVEKKHDLMTKLRSKFPEERKFLDNISVKPRLGETTYNKAQSIHVLVDASNVRTRLGHLKCPPS